MEATEASQFVRVALSRTDVASGLFGCRVAVQKLRRTVTVNAKKSVFP
jgi:hypothetical protein